MNTAYPALNFNLGEDIDMLRDSLFQFCQNEIAPRAAEIDQSNEFPNDLWRKNGTVVTLLVEVGASVSKGETLMVMEAMKMEHDIIAPADGSVSEFFYQAGELVDGGAELLNFTAVASSEES